MPLSSQITLVADQAGESLFVKAETEQVTLLHTRELFSFGSGTWYDGTDAVELMESDSPWLSCAISLDSLVILEKKRILTHVASLTCLDKPTPLRQLLTLLEDVGEASFQFGMTLVIVCFAWFVFSRQVKVTFSHHAVSLADDSCVSEKALCFGLDTKALKEEEAGGEPAKKKRKRGKKDKEKEKDKEKKARFRFFLLACQSSSNECLSVSASTFF